MSATSPMPTLDLGLQPNLDRTGLNEIGDLGIWLLNIDSDLTI